jgi:hypothetical protein
MKLPSRLVVPGLLAVSLCLVALFSFTSCGPAPTEPKPALQYKATAEGCADFLVYKWNDAMTEAIVVQARKEDLGLSTHSRTFRLDSIPPGSLSVRIDLFPTRQQWAYCSDVVNPDHRTPTSWYATSGTATITLDHDSTTSNEVYKATVKLQNVHLSNGTTEVTVGEQSFNDVTVGWLPG